MFKHDYWSAVAAIGLWFGTAISSAQVVEAQQAPAVESVVLSRPASTVVHPDWCYNASIYEVNIRQYTPEGTFNAFREHLPRLQVMGVGILWLMPIHPIGEAKRKGERGSYYAVQDFLKVNPEYGTLDDFKALVDDAHRRGMRVILDWVPNHTAWDNVLTQEHPEWYTRDENGNFTPPVPEWDDVIDLNYDEPGLRRYMLNALAYWVREAGMDGYRVDVAGMVPVAFWAQARRELSEIKPVFLLAEWDDPEAHRDAYDMTYAWSLNGVFHRIVNGEATAEDLWAHLEAEDENYPAESIRMYFTSNHDENSWNGSAIERYGDAAEAFAVLTLTLDGMPLIYSGQEAGNGHRLAFFDKDQITWRDHKLAEVYRTLLRLRKANKALAVGGQGGTVNRLDEGKATVFSFSRQRNDHGVIVVANLSDRPVDVNVKSPLGGHGYADVFTGESTAWLPNDTLHLEPWGYRVLAR